MSNETADREVNRREMVRKLAAGAFVAGAAGTAAAEQNETIPIAEIDDGETIPTELTPEPDRIVSDIPESVRASCGVCWEERDCSLYLTCTGPLLGVLLSRWCCNCDGDTFCDDWEPEEKCACDPYA